MCKISMFVHIEEYAQDSINMMMGSLMCFDTPSNFQESTKTRVRKFRQKYGVLVSQRARKMHKEDV